MGEAPRSGGLSAESEAAFRRAAEHAIRFRQGVDQRPIGPTADYAAMLARFGGPVPETGRPADRIIDDLAAHADGGLMGMVNPRFFGWVVGASDPVGVTASYLPEGGAVRDPFNYTPELSRRARGFAVWAVLSRLGRAGLAEMVGRHCRVARAIAGRLAAEPGVRVLNDVVLNQVAAAFGPEDDREVADTATRETLARLQRDSFCYPSHGVWRGQEIMRISVTSQVTDEAEGERAAEAIIAAWRQVRDGVPSAAATP